MPARHGTHQTRERQKFSAIRFACSTCGKSFRSPTGLSVHKTRVHPQAIPSRATQLTAHPSPPSQQDREEYPSSSEDEAFIRLDGPTAMDVDPAENRPMRAPTTPQHNGEDAPASTDENPSGGWQPLPSNKNYRIRTHPVFTGTALSLLRIFFLVLFKSTDSLIFFKVRRATETEIFSPKMQNHPRPTMTSMMIHIGALGLQDHLMNYVIWSTAVYK